LSGTCIVQRGTRFAVVAYAGIDPVSKKERRKWFGGFKTRREAEQFRVTLAHSPAFSAGAGPYGSPHLRVQDFIRAWIDERETIGKIRPKTAAGYRDLCRLHVFSRLGHVPLARVSPPALQSLYVSLMAEQGLSAATAAQIAAILHAALNDAVRRGLIARNPCANTDPPTAAPYDPVVLTPEQIGVYLADVDRTALPPLRGLYYTAIGAGCRLGELLGCRDADVDPQAGVLHVRRSLSRAGAAPVTGRPKTDHGLRTILLPEAATAAIRAALSWKKEQRLRLGPKFRDAGLLFCGARGRPINPSNLRNRDHLPRLTRLGLPRVRPHDLRHANATHLTAAGVDPRTLADRLGHSRPSFTMERYSHASTRAQERAAEVANDLLTKTGRFGS